MSNGVRQGCVFSPTLFSFLIDELALDIAQNGMCGVQRRKKGVEEDKKNQKEKHFRVCSVFRLFSL